MVRSWDDCVDLGYGRGRAERSTAEAIWRIDRDLGRPADVNEAWRSPEQANANRARWLAYERYLNGGPWAPKAPYALGAEDSVHCDGTAVDSDDWYDSAAAAVWRRHGFRQTARYPGTARDEPWHGEHRAEWEEKTGAPAGNASTFEEDDMVSEDAVRAMFDATNRNLADIGQRQHDVTRAFIVDQAQRQHDVTRGLLADLTQKQHDVTRGYIVDTVVGALGKITPTIDNATLEAAVKEAVSGVKIDPIDIDELVARVDASIEPVDINAIAKRVNDEADERERQRLNTPTAS